MSFLTSPATQHHLVYNYLTELKSSITNLRINAYLSRRQTRVLSEGTKVRNVDWFEELPQGCLFYMEGKKYPIRGIISIEAVNEATKWKRAIPMFSGFLQGKGIHSLGKKNIFQKAFILLSLFINWKFYIYYIRSVIYDYTYDEIRKFSPPVREIYDLFPKELENERDVFTFFLEADHAYKYRFQDAFSELDKQALRINPLKEITRLMDIMISRESSINLATKWQLIKKTIVPIYYLIKIFNKKLYNQLLKMAEDLDIEKIKPTKEDIFWMNEMDSSYNFRGLSWESRKLLNK
jgi:hypothetical protein